MKSGPGMAMMVAVACTAAAAAVAWTQSARGAERRDRRLMLGTAAGGAVGTTALMHEVARRGYLTGGLLEVPTPVRFAIDVPYTTGVLTAWLAGYRALATGSRHPLMIGALMGVGLGAMAFAIEPWEMERGYFKLGRGYRVADNAMVSVAFGVAPVLAYEGLKRATKLNTPSPSPWIAWYGGQGAGLGVG
jgi:hypothetical protein